MEVSFGEYHTNSSSLYLTPLHCRGRMLMLGCWEALESFMILSSEKKTVDFESYWTVAVSRLCFSRAESCFFSLIR